jgi:hypothetical protein
MTSGIKGTRKTYICLWCNNPVLSRYNRINKYCSKECENLYKWEHQTKPRIERGEVVDYRPLKKYLIEKFSEKCSCCGIDSTWNNMPLTLQLDHIDGDSDNNLPSNLRLLCPNCHSQTETFGSKGKGNRYRKDTKRNKYLQEYKARLV